MLQIIQSIANLGPNVNCPKFLEIHSRSCLEHHKTPQFDNRKYGTVWSRDSQTQLFTGISKYNKAFAFILL